MNTQSVSDLLTIAELNWLDSSNDLSRVVQEMFLFKTWTHELYSPRDELMWCWTPYTIIRFCHVGRKLVTSPETSCSFSTWLPVQLFVKTENLLSKVSVATLCMRRCTLFCSFLIVIWSQILCRFGNLLLIGRTSQKLQLKAKISIVSRQITDCTFYAQLPTQSTST